MTTETFNFDKSFEIDGGTVTVVDVTFQGAHDITAKFRVDYGDGWFYEGETSWLQFCREWISRRVDV